MLTIKGTKKFARDLEKDYKNVTKGVDKAFEKTAVYGWGLITARTPVDLGQARAGWLIDTDKMSAEVPTDGLPSYPAPVAPAVSFSIGKNESLFIYDNVKHVEFLEGGTDNMQAFGMVANSIGAIESRLALELKKIK